MNFLIINPWIYDSSAYDFWLKPLGLLYVAKILKDKEHNVEFIDLLDRYDPELIKINDPKSKEYGDGKFYIEEVEKPNVLKNIPRKFKRYGLKKDIFLKKLKDLKNIDAILMGVTLTYWYYGGLKTIEEIRKIFPKTPIFLGGIYASLMREHAKTTFSRYNVNIISKTGIEAINEVLKDFQLKIENFDWFEKTDLDYGFYKSKLPYAVILSSIGCPFHCSYCVTPKMWKYKYRSIKKINNNISKILLQQAHIKDIVFFDDAFLIRKDIEEFLESLSRYKVRFHLPNGIHARLVNKKIAKLLYKANFRTIRLGYETYNENLQKKTGGKVTNYELERSVKNLIDAGIDPKEISAYVIINLPGQNRDDIIKAIDFCKNLNIGVSLNEFTPIPSTLDYIKLVKNGLLPKNINPLLLNNSYIPYWWKYGMSPQEIHEIKNYCYEN